MESFQLLIINPGSTSTKVALYRDEDQVISKTESHPVEKLAKFDKVSEQLDFRLETIRQFLDEQQIDVGNLAAVVGRGGLIKPIPGGTYEVNQKMLEDLIEGVQGQHASNLGGILASRLALPHGIPAYIVDPVVVDEMQPIARITGLPQVSRRSVFHALNQRAEAHKAAMELGKEYHNSNLIVVHMGGGISVGAHIKGRIVDVNNALDGDGPMSPERSGSLPVGDLVNMCYSGSYAKEDLKKLIAGQGGLVAHLGINDATIIEERINGGDERAAQVYMAMAYQIAKEIGACGAVLKGDIDGIVITGGLAHSNMLVEWIKERVAFLGPVLIYPGEAEMHALAQGALRVLRGKEEVKIY